jgi:hypothetical protein
MGAGASFRAVTQWSAEEVGHFICGIGEEYVQYKDAFIQKRVNGKTLLSLDDADLVELGIESDIHTDKFMQACHDLQEADVERKKREQQAIASIAVSTRPEYAEDPTKKYSACICQNREEALIESRYIQQQIEIATGKSLRCLPVHANTSH